jgi:spore germination protein GerM
MVRYLLTDAGTNGLGTCIPPETRLNSIRVERLICHVDFSSEFLEDPQMLPTAIRVLTASLCTLDHVFAVNITVDGRVPEGYPPSQFGVLVPKSDWFI